MKSFYQYILEATMTAVEALKIFGVTEIGSKEELNKLYKKLALKYHPDHQGGSDEMMKQLNTAKEVLSKFNGGTSSKSGKSSDIDKQEEQTVKIIEKMFKSFDKKKFCAYFDEIFDDKFEVTKFDYSKPLEKEKQHLGSSRMKLEMEFSNKDRNKVVELNMYTDIIAVVAYKLFEKPSLSDDSISIEFIVHTNTFINGKKEKIVNKNYDITKKSKIFSDPTEIFPEARMKKIAGGKARAKAKTKKSDFVNLFSVKYKSLLKPYYDESKEWVIQYGHDSEFDRFIRFERRVIDRLPFYYYSIYLKDSSKELGSLRFNSELSDKMRNMLDTKYKNIYDESKETLEFFDMILSKILDARSNDKWLTDRQLHTAISKANSQLKFDEYLTATLK